MTITRTQKGDYVAVDKATLTKAYGYSYTEAIINCLTLIAEPEFI